MDENSILNRLYSEQINGTSFQEADGIIWVLEELSRSEKTREFKIISSSLWLGDLAEVTNFEAQTHADSPQEESDGAQV